MLKERTLGKQNIDITYEFEESNQVEINETHFDIMKAKCENCFFMSSRFSSYFVLSSPNRLLESTLKHASPLSS